MVSLLAGMVAQLREQVRICLMKKREGPEADETVDKMWQLIESNPTDALCFWSGGTSLQIAFSRITLFCSVQSLFHDSVSPCHTVLIQ
jgi:hypothetical protein